MRNNYADAGISGPRIGVGIDKMDITHDHPLHSLCLRGATFFQNVRRHVFALKRMATPRNAQIRQQDNANSAIAMQIRQSEMQRTFATSGANMRVKGYRFLDCTTARTTAQEATLYARISVSLGCSPKARR